MQLEVIGVGAAGCRIADAIHAGDPAERSVVGTAFAFDVDGEDVTALQSIPVARRFRYGETIENGLNGNLQRGFTVGEEHVDELSRHLDDGQPSIADAFVVAVGLGGATGGGTVPALVENLQRLYDKPVYVLATLPATSELEPSSDDRSGSGSDAETRPMAEENAVRTLERLEGSADAVIAFDNEEWLRSSETVLEARDRLNRELADRVLAFFTATASGTDEPSGAETIIDANDVARILGDETGIATIGYGKQQVETDDGGSRFGLGLFSAETSVDTTTAISAIETTIQKGLRGKLTLECDRGDADRALLVVGGPPAWLNRQAIADGRSTLESATGSAEILSGDAPRPDSDQVFAVVLLAGVEPAGRLAALRSRTKPLDRRRAGE
ncbi:cell division protein FtsZ [Salinadaptatus halalkaliphilus]|uniref:Tubulin-like protein CetZ n=1 Tax=Salinadaptatus halalkaliphilus TaxID=2419781 RepID=A0A4S3TNI5_9EURY|nr:tubulin/FtsZ family protein [Salinadaptatus halalkaliphilus]THE65746.1 cell division protein FtsZ [Salinadaptatus halalkaliphilus]